MRLPRIRFVLPLIAVASLAFSNVAQVDSVYESDQRISAITFEAACRLSRYNCKRMRSPVVRRSVILGEQGIRGAYWLGSPIVWLDTPLRGTQLWLTIFHEQVHYLQVRNGADDNDMHGRLISCMMEREALDFTNAYARELGAYWLQRTLKEWRRLYNCNPNIVERLM